MNVNRTRIYITCFALWFIFFSEILTGQTSQFNTYCIPLNIDYTYLIYNVHNNLSYGSGANLAVVEFHSKYYMFVTCSMGYCHSACLLNPALPMGKDTEAWKQQRLLCMCVVNGALLFFDNEE